MDSFTHPELPPCPECSCPITLIEPIFRQGERIPLSLYNVNSYVQEPDTVKGFRLRPCLHVVKSFQWEMKTVFTYGEIVPDG